MKWTPSLTATLLFAGVAVAAPKVAPSPGPVPGPKAGPSPRMAGPRAAAPRVVSGPEAVAGARSTYAVAALAPLLAHVYFVEGAEVVELQKLQGKSELTPEERTRIEELVARSRKLAEELSALQREKNPTAEQRARLEELLAQRKNAFQLREFVRTPLAGSASATLLESLGVGQFQQRIDLDLKEASVQEAAQQILKLSGLEAELKLDEPSMPAKLTLQVKGIRASTALDVVADAAGVRWGVERKDGKTTLRIGKDAGFPFYRASASGTPAASAFVYRGDARASEPFFVPLQQLPQGQGTVHVSPSTIARFSFTCPHCTGRVSMIRRSTDPDCGKCGQRFQRDWKFCPADGTKRPSPQPDVKFCPLCGKRVEMERGSSQGGPSAPVVSDVKEEDEVVFQIEGDPRQPLVQVDPERPFLLRDPSFEH